MNSWSIFITALVSSGSAILAVIITYILTKKREHEGEWRKLKFAQYQEFVLALSGIVNERSTRAGQARYSDAVNSMALIAPMSVLQALTEFQAEISIANKRRSDEKHDTLLNGLYRAMRADIHPYRLSDPQEYVFKMLGVPPTDAPTP